MTIPLRLTSLALVLLCCAPLFGQGDVCVEFEEFCPAENGSDLSFPAGVNSGDAEFGNNYGCLTTQPNPAWYYLQIGAPGSVTIQLFNSNTVDIDFALWGPFEDLDAAQANCGTLPFPTDCSYSTAAFETVQVPFSNTDEIYILLITNYSNDATNINAEATGDGVPVCCRTPINQAESCPEAFDFDCGCWTTGITGTLPTTNPGAAIPDFCGSLDNQQWLSFASCWCAISLEVFAPECASGTGVEAQLFSSCAPYEPVTECAVIPEGESVVLTALQGDTVLRCTPGEEYLLLIDGVVSAECDYIVRANALDLPPPAFQQDTVFGPAQVCTGDTLTYTFPPFSGEGVCTANFIGDGEVLSVTHGAIVVAIGEDTGSGQLCIEVNGCEGSDSYCMPISIIECCFSEAGTLDYAEWLLCPNDGLQVVHQGDSLIDPIDTAYYVLHDGTATTLGNVLATSSDGSFAYDPAYVFEQTYYVHFLVTRIVNGQPDFGLCFGWSANGNPVVWYADAPALAATPEQYVCDDEARTYRVSFEVANGTPPYRVDGELLVSNVFTSAPIESGMAYSFSITSENPCLDPLIVSGSYVCPCDTEAGALDPALVELCGEETVTITAFGTVLDGDDVLIYQLRALDGTLLVQNSDGVFGYAPLLDYGNRYEVRAVAGNDTGNGPLTDYPCASESNAKEIVFYEEVRVSGPTTVEIRCNDPTPALPVEVTGGSGSYTYLWTGPGGTADSVVWNADGPGLYTFTASDSRSSCAGSTTIEVVEAPLITDVAAQLVAPLCTGDDNGSIVLDSVIGGVPPYRYRLDDQAEVGLAIFEFLPAGEYDLAIRDANDCRFITKITLDDPAAPQLDLGGNQLIALGEVATVTAQTNVADPTLRWQIDGWPFADSLQLLSFDSLFLDNALVEAQVFDANDCSTTARALIILDKESPLFVPTAFSPNEDGVNDRLTVFGNPAAVDRILDMQIYDRWGSQVYANAGFTVNEQFTGWDGFFRGQRAGTGIYVWTLRVRYIDGRTERTSGEVLLMR